MIRKALSVIFIVFAYAGSLHARGASPYIFDLPAYQTCGSGILLLDVGHRYFDPMSHTTNINITLGYGITGWWDVYLARSFKNMDSLFSTKFSLLDDSGESGDMLSLSLAAGGGYKEDTESVLAADDRASYFGQVIIQKHLFGNRLAVGTVPTFAYNTNFYGFDSEYDYSAGIGVFLQIYVTDKISLCGEVVPNVYGFAFEYMTYNAGVRYAAYRHTFALWLTNSGGYSPVEYAVGHIDLKPKVSFAFTREFDL